MNKRLDVKSKFLQTTDELVVNDEQVKEIAGTPSEEDIVDIINKTVKPVNVYALVLPNDYGHIVYYSDAEITTQEELVADLTRRGFTSSNPYFCVTNHYAWLGNGYTVFNLYKRIYVNNGALVGDRIDISVTRSNWTFTLTTNNNNSITLSKIVKLS